MELTKKELERLYYGNKNIDVCKELGISLPTLLKYLEKAGIKKKGNGNHFPNPKIKIIN